MSWTQHLLLTLTWNAGGLTQALWQELLLTLAHMKDADRPQIVCYPGNALDGNCCGEFSNHRLGSLHVPYHGQQIGWSPDPC